MEKIKTAKQILKELGVTEKQQNDLSCNVLLALANIKEDSQWTDAENSWIRIHDIISYLSENYNINYAENSRETIRKQVLHHFNNAAFIENNNKSTNSPNYKYRLTDEFLELIRTYSTKSWDLTKKKFLENHKTLVEKYTTKRELTKIPVVINNENLTFSKGEHNQLQKLIIEEFGPRFAPGAECLYVGSSIDKKTGKFKRLCFLENKVKIFNELYPNAHIDNFYTDSMNDKAMMDIADHVYLVNGNKIEQIK